MKVKLKKILSILLTILLILSIGLVSIGLIQKITNKKIIPYQIVWVRTDSMEDTIPAQSFILVKNIDDPSILQEGDVILFRSSDTSIDGEYNTHRIVDVLDNNTFKTKGDNVRATVDKTTVSYDDIEGIYIRNLPIASFFGRIFVTKYGLVLVFILIIGGFVIWERTSRKQEKLEEDKEAYIKRAIEEEVKRLEKENK